jgi:hypothetical protein
LPEFRQSVVENEVGSPHDKNIVYDIPAPIEEIATNG